LSVSLSNTGNGETDARGTDTTHARNRHNTHGTRTEETHAKPTRTHRRTPTTDAHEVETARHSDAFPVTATHRTHTHTHTHTNTSEESLKTSRVQGRSIISRHTSTGASARLKGDETDERETDAAPRQSHPAQTHIYAVSKKAGARECVSKSSSVLTQQSRPPPRATLSHRRAGQGRSGRLPASARGQTRGHRGPPAIPGWQRPQPPPGRGIPLCPRTGGEKAAAGRDPAWTPSPIGAVASR
jgi:hypothetical protein